MPGAKAWFDPIEQVVIVYSGLIYLVDALKHSWSHIEYRKPFSKYRWKDVI